MAGRPTKYDEAMQTLAEMYVSDCTDTVPNVAGLAVCLRVAKSTVYLWGKEHEAFSDTLSEILARQENMLLNGGLNGDFNAAITKLMLANHGYHDKTDNTLASPDGGPIVVERRIIDP